MNAVYTYLIIFIFLCLIGYIYYGYRSNEKRNKIDLENLNFNNILYNLDCY